MLANPDWAPVTGGYFPDGMRTTEDVHIAGTDVRGYGMLYMASPNNEDRLVLASGDAIGAADMKLDNYGTLNDSFRLNQFIPTIAERGDWPEKKPNALTLRVYVVGSIMEVEGLGGPGASLVVTTGAKALSAATAAKTELTAWAGGWALAVSGDIVLATVLKSDLTPQTSGRVRLRIQIAGKYKKA